ncbi:hypothetical protein VHEMI06085 [[Torrubiella] hemipterigena]|uniref:Extracellular protein n=1 Tax=[Torrubiella] hemipterigena TaxID=1531966 RepID=A0A0A1TKA9_9HYPO|nr:hypothetical protein VHEMI06085 [[Torrubiella] hemipterigena]
MKSFIAILTSLAVTATAHMEMTWPPPFRSEYNPYTTDIDYDMTSPLDANGDNYPCKGYQNLLDTPQGPSVVTWYPGQTYNLSVTGSATHEGGSCQVSFSYDRGATWTVIQSWIGGCPLKPNWTYTLPTDLPIGDALFAWSWFNKVGNREMYMNCAHVTIARGPSGRSVQSSGVPYASRPPIFAANVNNGCGTTELCDLVFPQPGPDVVQNSSETCPPVGNCAGVGK